MAGPSRRLGVPGWGFALFLAVNAVQVWGGVFPFLPLEFQTVTVTLSFYASQAAASVATYVACLAEAYRSPALTARIMPKLAAPPMIAGCLALIAAMYVHSQLAIYLVVCSGVLQGLGSTSMALLWQRAFSSCADERGDLLLVLGTGLSALIYLALYICPVAVTAYLVPLVFLPLCAAALTVSTRTIDLDQPMFTDVPREHPGVYRRFAHDYWRSALSAGAVGFVAGIMRAVALADVTAGYVVNLASMLGALLSAGIVVGLWRGLSFHLSMRKAYRWAFPLLTLAIVGLPFVGGMAYLDVFAGVMYAFYAFVQMVLLIQCAQASRDRGVCPIVTYAFCSGIMHVMHFAGFLCGWATGLADGLSMLRLCQAALLAVWVLAMVLFCIWVRPSHAAQDRVRSPDAVEFMSLAPSDAAKGLGQARLKSSARRPGKSTEIVDRPTSDPGQAPPREDTPNPLEIPVRPVLDRVTKQCEAIRLAFRLSDRETEVMEHIARGDTVARIAEKLGVSENTVRTHAKRVYFKLGIHSKQELGDLVQSFEPLKV